jgi:outer membrane protein OmpA-like peptidoglycan-associated protein
MIQIKQPSITAAASLHAVPTALALCLGLGGLDLAVLNVWVLPRLLTATDISASRNISPEPARPARPARAATSAAKASSVAIAAPAPAPQLTAASEPRPSAQPAAVLNPEPERPLRLAEPAPSWTAAPNGVVTFGSGAVWVGPRSRQALNELANEVRDGDGPVLVAGHADRPGPRDLNQRLSEQRARAVAAVLVGAGIPQGRIEVRGYGEEQPSADGRDRRVEIRLGGAP